MLQECVEGILAVADRVAVGIVIIGATLVAVWCVVILLAMAGVIR